MNSALCDGVGEQKWLYFASQKVDVAERTVDPILYVLIGGQCWIDRRRIGSNEAHHTNRNTSADSDRHLASNSAALEGWLCNKQYQRRTTLGGGVDLPRPHSSRRNIARRYPTACLQTFQSRRESECDHIGTRGMMRNKHLTATA